jgi:peroxiredoxin
VGAVAPDFVLPNTSREMRRLDDLVANRPVIVVFYRGYW